EAVSARVGPRGERRPGDRRLGGARGGDPCEAAVLPQPGNVGELPRIEQPRRDAGVQAVQTDDDDLLDGSILVRKSSNATGADGRIDEPHEPSSRLDSSRLGSPASRA